jgi:hypothetical protein
MKLIEHTTTIEKIGNVGQEETFRMKSSRKAFQILSDLYSDKPLAIVRELGCNAMDSHVAAGNKNPFRIHLPNTLEPWITIQDFGTGIAHEDIYGIYAVYFESTKTNTNDQIGCLGLGSKSPFCYADSFMITSIKNGKKNVYNAYFNEMSTPAIAHLSCEDTNEHSGVAIQIPVKKDDFNKFADCVKNAFRFFDVKPEITGGKIDWSIETPVFEGQGWKSYDKFGYGDCYAIMGGVTYPIDLNKIDHKNRDLAVKGGLVIQFAMGELDFTPSRESLSYHPATIKALNDKFDFIKNDFLARVQDSLQNKPNIFEVIRAMWILQNKYSHVSGLKLDQGVKWKGIDISHPFDLIRKICQKNGNNSWGVTYYKQGWNRTKITESNQPSLEVKSKWLYDDGIKGAVSRVRNYCRENDEKISLFSHNSYVNMVNDGFPASCFEPVSSLPKPVVVRKTRTGGVVNHIQKGTFNVYEIGDCSNKSWEGVNIDPQDPNVSYPKYYIEKGENWDFCFKHKDFFNDINDKYRLKSVLRFMEIDKDDVVMVSKQNVKRLPKTCTSFADALEKIDLSFDAVEFETAFHYSDVSSVVKNKGFAGLPDSEFKKAFAYVNTCQKKYYKFKNLREIILSEMFFTPKAKPWVPANEVVKLILKKIGHYTWDDDSIIILGKNLK